jgi:hypothetical protein
MGEAGVTVKVESFFGVHKAVMQSGLWAVMKPGEKDLYDYVNYLSEAKSSRELQFVTDAEISDWTGCKARTLCRARKKLVEYGLVRCQRSAGNRYNYVLCNPITGEPYPGKPTDKPTPYDPDGPAKMRQRLQAYLRTEERRKMSLAAEVSTGGGLQSYGMAMEF